LNKKIFFLFLFIASSALAEDIKIIKNTALYSDPSLSSKKILDVQSQSKGIILEKKGFWVKVNITNQQGWVKLSDVALPAVNVNIDPNSTGRSAGNNIVNTAGVRGFSPEELKASKPNIAATEEAIKASIKITESDVKQFMADANLVAKNKIPNLKNSSTSLRGNVNSSEPKLDTSNNPKNLPVNTKSNKKADQDNDW
jgi:hypothetical protein